MDRLRQKIKKILGVKDYKISFELYEINTKVLFEYRQVCEQFEIFLKNEAIRAINQKKYDKARNIDELLGAFLSERDLAYGKKEDIADKPAAEQIQEVYKNITPTIAN